MIIGLDKDYFWILVWIFFILDEVCICLLEKVILVGYDVSKFIWVEYGEENL